MRLEQLSYSTLMETVNLHTKKFIRFLLVGGNQKDFLRCKEMLDQLITELRRRRSNKKLRTNTEIVKQENNLNSLLGLIRMPVTTFN